jgi:hypothetical protein
MVGFEISGQPNSVSIFRASSGDLASLIRSSLSRERSLCSMYLIRALENKKSVSFMVFLLAKEHTSFFRISKE